MIKVIMGRCRSFDFIDFMGRCRSFFLCFFILGAPYIQFS